MSNGYIRQSSGLIVTGQTIQASHFNNEFNALQLAFSGTVGHDHTGAAGTGPILTPAGGGSPVFLGGTVGGTGNAITLTDMAPDSFALTDKYAVVFRPTSANTSAITINIDGLGAVPVKKLGLSGYLDMDIGDFQNGILVYMVYDSANSVFQVITTIYAATPTLVSLGFVASFTSLWVRYVATAILTITLPSILTVPSYYWFEVQAKGGAVTITPNGVEVVQGGAGGASYTIPAGTSAVIYKGSDNKWYVNGTSNTQPITAGGTGAITASAARTALGLAINSDVQAYDATLAAIAAYNTNGLLTQTASDTFVGRTITGTAGTIAVTNGNGVSGNPTITIDSGYIGQTTITTLGTVTDGTWASTEIAVARGGTGATDANAARINLGLAIGSNVQAFDSDLSALAANVTNGMWTRTGTGTGAARTITGTGNLITVTNGDGVSGNPTLTVGSSVVQTSRTLTAAGLVTGGGDLSSDRTFTVTAATQANMETATSTTTAVTPAVVQNHPGVAKFWVMFDGTTGNISVSYNVTSVTRNAAGDYSINLTTAFSSANYALFGMANSDAGVPRVVALDDDNANTASVAHVEVYSNASAGTKADSVNVMVVGFGDQ